MDSKTTKIFSDFIKVVIIIFLSSLIVYWLWNGLAVDLFGFKQITFWQALGIKILFNTLFSPSKIDTDKE